MSRCRAWLIVVLVPLLTLTWPTVAAPAAETGTISGSVTGYGAGPLAGVRVRAERYLPSIDRWTDGGEAVTDVQGTYSVSGLTPATYRVYFDRDPAFRFLPEFADDQGRADWATHYVVAPGTDVDVDAELDLPGVMAGTVTGEDAGPIPADVEFLTQGPDGGWDVLHFGGAGTAGTFNWVNARPGDYKIVFTPGIRHFPEWYDDAATRDTATIVHLEQGEQVTDITADLAAAGRITGRVTDATGAPLTTAIVAVHAAADGWPGAPIRYAYPDDEGTYELGRLTTGEYTIQFSDGSHRHAGEWWDDESLFDHARRVSVVTGELVSKVDARLSTGGTVFGQVTSSDGSGGPIESVDVVAWERPNGVWKVAATATTDAAGRYALRDVPAGTYRIAFQPQDPTWLPTYYDGEESLETAEPIDVTAPFDTYDISVRLHPSGPTPTETVTVSPTVTPTSTPTASTTPAAVPSTPGPTVATTPSAVSPTRVLNVTRPRIAGRAVVGRRLRVTTGEWSPSAVTLRYRWFAGGTRIRGADGPVLTVRPGQVGERIKVSVVARYPGAEADVARTVASGRVRR